MTTQRGAEDRRKHPRINRVGLVVSFKNQVFSTRNWSMGGFLLEDYEGELSTGALVTVSALGRDTRAMQSVNLPARVVRTGAATIAVNYLSLDTIAYAFLQDAMRETGEMRLLLEQSA